MASHVVGALSGHATLFPPAPQEFQLASHDLIYMSLYILEFPIDFH